MAKVRVLRILEYIADDREILEKHLERRYVKRGITVGGLEIREAIIGEFPENLDVSAPTSKGTGTSRLPRPYTPVEEVPEPYKYKRPVRDIPQA
jgi:hypothetical protein